MYFFLVAKISMLPTATIILCTYLAVFDHLQCVRGHLLVSSSFSAVVWHMIRWPQKC